jgi:hypothetical protein
MRVRSRDVDIAIKVDPQGIDRPLPARNILELVEEEIGMGQSPRAIHDDTVEFPIVIETVVFHRFHLERENTVAGNVLREKILLHKVQQRGFAASAHAGYDLDKILVLERLKALKISRAFDHGILHVKNFHLLQVFHIMLVDARFFETKARG